MQKYRRFGFLFLLGLLILNLLIQSQYSRAIASTHISNLDSTDLKTTAELSLPEISSETLLFSDSWYGSQLLVASNKLGISISNSKLDYLNDRAAIDSINTRLILTLVAINPNISEASDEEWGKWVVATISQIKQGLGPYDFSTPPLLSFDNNENFSLNFETTSIGAWVLINYCAQGKTVEDAQSCVQKIASLYNQAFGDPSFVHTETATDPFLVHPYSGQNSGRGFFDHKYPTCTTKFGCSLHPSVPGDDSQMIDYLGRTDSRYDTHDGDDFWLNFGTRLVSPVTGSVTSIGSDYVLLTPNNPQGYEIFIGHMSRLDVTRNENVIQGETQLGTSGSFNGVNHIHFEVRHFGKQTDTMGWFSEGPDPCPGLPAQGAYLGCESSSWLWIDENPPVPEPIQIVSGEKQFSSWLPWYYSITTGDDRIVDVSLDGQFLFRRPSCSIALWIGRGAHTISFMYENRGGGVPQITINSWPFIDPICSAPPLEPPPTGTPIPPAEIDEAIFISDLTVPDGSIVSPGQSLTKTWRMRNTGTTTWGDGYQLVFINGERMGAPSEINVPATSPNQDVDLSVNITAPSTPGEHAGYWRLRNPQGTYFGPTIWVKINIQSNSSRISMFTADPSSPSDTSIVRFYSRVDNFPNFRAMRIKVDGEVKFEIGAPEFYWDWNTSGYSTGDHSIVVEVADQTDTSWSRPDIRSMVYSLTGTGGNPNHAPERPSLMSPHDWYVYTSGNTAQLCAQANGDPDGDVITGYYFSVTGAEGWNSNWVSSSCVTTAGLGPHNYEWKVKVRDARGGESDWSNSWHFTLVNPSLSITQLYFESQDSYNERVKIRACTEGQAGIGITMRVSINEANDGSSNGKWNIIYELGVPCFNDIDAPIWNTLRYSDGTHRVRVEAHGLSTGWDGAAVREEVFTLPHRRPDGPILFAPIPQSLNSREAIFLNTRTIKFQWESTIRSNNYTLHIGTETNPQTDPTPIYRQTFDSSTTQTEYTLNQDFPVLYWQVTASNDVGNSSSNDQLIGIDRTSPSCTILPLPNVTYENYYQVSWSSSDDLSGIKSVDIEFMDSDRGEWVNWLSSIPSSKTYDLFNGQAGHMYQFRCKATDQANNTGGYSENSNTILVDPSSRPSETWWDGAYTIKRSITILNNMADRTLPTEYPVHLRFDSTTFPSSNEIYNMSLSTPKCHDIRIVYDNSVELDRFLPSCENDLIEIWFSTKSTITAGSADSISYRLYISNPNAINPPSDQTKIWPPLIDEYTKGLWFLSEGAGSNITDYSGQGNTGYPGILNWIYGKFGYALASPYRSNGNNALFVPSSASLGSSAFTLDFFAQRYDLGGGYIAGQGMSGDNRERMRLQVEGPGVIKFQIDPLVGGASDIWARSGCLSDLQWHHIAITFDGYRTGQIFCDGILSGSGQFNDSGISNLNFNLHIGSDFSSAERFHGAIDQIRYSNIVRSNFPHADLAAVTNEPTLGVGDQIEPPIEGYPDLTLLNLNIYPDKHGDFLVQTMFTNQSSIDVINGFYTDLYLNYPPIGPEDFSGSLSFWINDPIDAGETITLTTVIQDTELLSDLVARTLAPAEEVTGTLYAQVDSSGSITEIDDQNNISSSGTPFCVASPDGYEDDNDIESASIIHLGDAQRHNIDKPNGQDWVKFDAQAGTTYTLKTYNLGNASDTYIYLYDTDGTTLLASNDDYGGSLASQIQWQAPTTGTYYFLIRHWNPNASGCSTGYTLTIQTGSRLFLPSIVTK